jgi:hypothetical protein
LFRKVFRLNKAGKMFIKVVTIYLMLGFIFNLSFSLEFIASAVTGGINSSVDFGSIRVTAGGEVHLLAIGGRKRIVTRTNQEGRLDVMELQLGAAFGVGATSIVRIERIEPNIEE